MSNRVGKFQTWLNGRVLSAPMFDLAFRPMFLAAAAASVLALAGWILLLNGQLQWQGELLSPVLWHLHEMLFGFALTIAVGFLLTAVQTWTNMRSLHGVGLLLLLILWLVSRVFLLVASAADVAIVITLQLAWWGIVIWTFGRLLVKTDNRRNYLLVVLLTVLASLQVVFLLLASRGDEATALHIGRSVILFFSIMISIIAGRVVPMFTRNACANTNIKPTPTLDKILLLTSLSAAICFLISGFFDVPFSPGWLLGAAGLLHLYRLAHWSPQATLSVPLVWSLHLSYICLGIGLSLMAASFFTDELRLADAMHIVTIGTIGGMILAMISRVSLGHTGRPLTVNRWVAASFGLMIVAAIVRFVLVMMGQPLWGWNISALLWVAAFSIFLRYYWPVLVAPRL